MTLNNSFMTIAMWFTWSTGLLEQEDALRALSPGLAATGCMVLVATVPDVDYPDHGLGYANSAAEVAHAT